MKKIRFRTLLEEVGVTWATFFYVGFSPKAPGTMGSLAALPLAWWVWSLPPQLAWATIALIFFTGAEAARVVIRRTGQPDHQTIVIDEVVGILITVSVAQRVWWQYLLAFALFRLFDIWKPWPVRYIDRNWHTAYGSMMDDLVAALMSAATLFILLLVIAF